MPNATDSLAPTRYPSAPADRFEPPLAAWILEAQEASLRNDLAAAAHRPVDASDLMLLRLMDPVGLAATAHRSGIAGTGDDGFAGDDETSPDAAVLANEETLAGNEDSHGRTGGVQRVTKPSARRAAAGSAAPAVATRGVASHAAARELLDGIVVAQRISDYANAVQQRLLAAFCTPGVAVPISDLLDLGGDTLAAALATAIDEVAATRDPDTHDGAAAPGSGGSPSGARVGHGESSAGSADCERAVCERTACEHAACEAPTNTVNPSPRPDAPAAGRPDTATPPLQVPGTRAPNPLGTEPLGAEANRLGTATSNRIDDIATSRDRAITSPTWARVLRETAMKAASAEVACALHLAPVTARLRCENATEFVDHLPATLRAQERGEIDPYRARMLLERLDVLPPHLRARVERRVLPHALNLTSAAFRRLIDREVIAADPDAARRREERAKARRDVFSSRADDGTGVFTALVSAADAELAYRMLDSVAESLASAELARDRTRAQLRADTFTDLFRTLADTGYVSITRAGVAHQSDRAAGAAASTVQCTDQGASGLGTVDCSQHRGASEPDRDSPTSDSARAGQVDNPSVRDRSSLGRRGTESHASGSALSAGNDDTGRCSPASTPKTSSSGSSGSDPASDTDAHPGADTDAQVGRSDNDAHAPVTNSQATGSPASAFMGAALSHGPAGTVAAVRRPVALNVYLDAETLAGFADRPGEIGGFGAVTAETARALAASADTIRAILVRPADGNRACSTILDAGRTVYRPPDKTADYVIARDRTCCFPGCRMPARRCDLDHRHPYDSDGETCPCNLDTLCRTHHRLKTFTSWSAVRDPDNDRLVWTSPLGRTYRTEQPHLLLDGNQDGNAELCTSNVETDTESGRSDTVADDDPPPF